MTTRSWVLLVVGVALTLLIPGIARAQAADDTPEQRPPDAGAPRVRVFFDDRPTLELGDAIRVQLAARVDATLRADDADALEDDTFSWSGRRVELSGRVTRAVDFELSYELDDDEPLRDAWVDVNGTRAVAVRLGRFKVPFSAERLRSLAGIDFVNRSLAADYLAPGRDEGLMAHGELGRNVLEYAVGVFRNSTPERSQNDPAVSDRDQRPLWAARATSRPFTRRRGGNSSLRTLQIGVAMTRDRALPGLTGLGAATIYADDPLIDPVYVNGPRTGFGTELQWSMARLRVNAEWMRIRESRESQAIDGGDLADFLGRGWYVSTVYRVARWRDEQGSWLARALRRELEIGVRLEGISFGTGTLPTTGDQLVLHPRADLVPWHTLRALTLGATWRLNRFSRIQLNAIREKPDVPAVTNPLLGGERRWSSFLKFQFAL
jgi:hypothetical protein